MEINQETKHKLKILFLKLFIICFLIIGTFEIIYDELKPAFKSMDRFSEAVQTLKINHTSMIYQEEAELSKLKFYESMKRYAPLFQEFRNLINGNENRKINLSESELNSFQRALSNIHEKEKKQRVSQLVDFILKSYEESIKNKDLGGVLYYQDQIRQLTQKLESDNAVKIDNVIFDKLKKIHSENKN